MDDLEIIYSEDEEDVIEKIYFLCDISESNEEIIPDIDIKELLKSNLDTISEEKTIFTAVESIVKNEVIGERVTNLIKLALQEKIPEKFIFYGKEGEIINLKKYLQGKDSRTGLHQIIRNYFKISMGNFMLIYYLANKDTMNEDELIDNLNSLSNISDRVFDKVSLGEYSREVTIAVEGNIKMMREKLSRINAFYTEINALPFSNSPENIERTLEMEETEIEIFVRDGEYQFDIDSGGIIFDNMKTNNFVLLIVYNSFFGTNYYKLTEGNRSLSDAMNEEYNMMDRKPNHIYVFVTIMDDDSKKIKMIDIDLIESKMSFSYPRNTLNQIKDIIEKLFPNIVYVNEKKISLRGNFEIDFNNFSEIRMRYLTLFDKMVSNFIYINENASPRSLRKNTKYYFKNYEDKTGHSVSFNLLPIHNSRYLVDFRTKTIDHSSVNEFILVLSKLISYYHSIDFDQTLVGIIEERYIGEDGIGLGGEYIGENEATAKGRVRKIDNLRHATGMFPTNYYGKFCPCAKQPIIIDNKDVSDWENYSSPSYDGKKNVTLFPPLESKQRSKKYHFVCPENTYPYLYFMKNPTIDQKYPVLPCCGIVRSDDYIDDYDLIRKDEVDYMAKKNERRVRKENRLKTIKILSPDQEGVLPSDLAHFLGNIKKTSYSRRGVIKSNTSSFIHCLMLASEHLEEYLSHIDKRNTEIREKISNLIDIRKEYLSRGIRERDALIIALRDMIPNFVNLSVCAQETYEYEPSQVEEFVKDKEVIFDSLYYYRILESMFMVNIFVFSYEDGTTTLEKPNHNFYHIREFNEKLPTILLIKHLSRKSIPIYELIEVDKHSLGKRAFPFLREKEFLEELKMFIETKNYAVVKFDQIEKNAYNGINWNIILSDYKIISQDINDSGRMIKVNISTDTGEKISIFVKPSPPMNIKISKMIYETKKEEVIRTFGDNYVIGSEGLWYELKNFPNGVFIPCRDVRKLVTREKVCYEYVLLKNILKKNQVFYNIGIVRKNANIIKQIILWLWNISRIEDVDEWFETYVDLMVEKKIIDIINLTPIKIDYRFPFHINTTEDGIIYYENHFPLVFNLGKIRLYEKLFDVMKRYIKNYQYSLNGYPKIPNKSIIGLFNNEKDFKRYGNTKIIIGKENYDQYYSGIKNIENDIEIVKDSWSVRNKIFNYRSVSDGKYFLIQNTISERREEAIMGCLIWMIWKINLGYLFTRETVWKMIPDNNFLLEFLDMTEEEILEYSNKETDIETEKFDEAIYYLSKEKIPIPNEKIGKIYRKTSVEEKGELRIRYRNSDGIYDEYAPSRYSGEINVWEYGNGAYAIMLGM